MIMSKRTSSHVIMFNLLVCTYLLLILVKTTCSNNKSDRYYCRWQCVNETQQRTYMHSACGCEKRPLRCGTILRPTEEERKRILDTYNTLREKVASGNELRRRNEKGATNMNAFAYDYNLEYVAECWAKRCILEHDICRRTDRFEMVGQNYYVSSRKPCDRSLLIDSLYAWYAEIKYVTLMCVKEYAYCEAVKDYTQMVWANTTHVGCAGIQVSALSCMAICNFGPSGNQPGQSVYEIGSPGSKCKTRDKTYKSLCVAEKAIGSPITLRGYKDNNGIKLLSNSLLLLFISGLIYDLL